MKTFVKQNSKELRDILTKMGYICEQGNWEEEHFDMCDGIVLTEGNTFYCTVKETEPDRYEFDTYYCYDNEEMFEIFARYYHWNNLDDKTKSNWCSYCGCEGGCNMCENLMKVYNYLFVKYIGS